MSVLRRKSIADMTRRKGRSLLFILCMLLGVLGITAVAEANEQLGGAFLYSMDASAVPNIVMEVETLPSNLAQRLARLPNVQQFQTRSYYIAPWQRGGQQQAHRLQMIAYDDPQQARLWSYEIANGQPPGPGEIVLETAELATYQVKIGDTISVMAANRQWVSLRVVGSARTRGAFVWGGFFANPTAYINPATLRQLTATYTHPSDDLTRATQILVKAPDVATSSTLAAMQQVLARAHLPVTFANYRLSAEYQDFLLSVVGPLAVIRLLTGFSLLLVIVMLINAVQTLLTEQFNIIGTMKAIGGSRLAILRSYLLTINLYSLVGTALGLPSGLAVGYRLSVQLALLMQVTVGADAILQNVGPFSLSPVVLFTGIAVGLVIPLLAALWPLWRGTRITVREALASYGVQVRAGAGAAGLGRSAQWVPQAVWLGIRGLFRKRARASWTIGALALTCAIFFSIQITNASLGAGLAAAYHLPSFRPDIRVGLADLRDPENQTHAQPLIRHIQALPDVRQVIPWDRTSAVIGQQSVELLALPADPSLYQPNLVSGRWLREDEPGVLVINAYLAGRLQIRVGQSIEVAVDMSTAETTNILHLQMQVGGIVHELYNISPTANPNGMAGEIFMTAAALNTLMHKPADFAEFLTIRAVDPSPQALRQLQSRILQVLQDANLTRADAQTIQERMEGYVDPLPTIYSLFTAVSLLVALIGLLSLVHTIATSVLERRLEIGVLRSLGATGWRISMVFCIEALSLAALAGLLGLLVGIPGSFWMVNLLAIYLGPHDVFFAPTFLLGTLAFILLTASLASLVPAWGAARLRLQELLRYE